LWFANWGLEIRDWGLGIGDWGLGLGFRGLEFTTAHLRHLYRFAMARASGGRLGRRDSGLRV